jgi:hypothetical protein
MIKAESFTPSKAIQEVGMGKARRMHEADDKSIPNFNQETSRQVTTWKI